MRIDSSGNLLVNQTSTADYATTVGSSFRSSGFSTHTADANAALLLNRLTSDGDIAISRKDNTTVGSIASRLGVVSTIILDPRSGGAGLTGSGPGAIVPTNNTGASNDGATDLGTSDGRFKDLYLSGRIEIAEGTGNIGIGTDAGESLTTGTYNTFIGWLSGDDATTGSGNTAVGVTSMSGSAVTGGYNSALGQSAGFDVTSGSSNIFIGVDSGRSNSPSGSITTASNTICLGSSSIANAHIQVDWTVASDQRDKTDFTALDLGLNFVKALSPVTYKWDKRCKYGDITADDYDLNAQTPDGTHKEDWLDVGFKAQEVQALEEAAGYTSSANKNLTVSMSNDGKQLGLKYSKFVPILVKALQELSAKNDALEARITALEGE
jgi:hypothetical protein